MGFTGGVYADKVKIPLFIDKCSSGIRNLREDKTRGPIHPCKLHTEHEGDHLCICGVHWKQEKK